MIMKRENRYSEEPLIPSRVKKNQVLYDDIKDAEVDDFDITTTAKVIGDSSSFMDVDKIKDMLEKNYQRTPPKRTVNYDEIKTDDEIELEIEKTREYDINEILEKAREDKEVDYEEDRLRKVRDTNFDILKDLNISTDNRNEDLTDEKTVTELRELIDTIDINALKNKQKAMEEDPLDLFGDLRGSDDNTVVAGVSEFTGAVLDASDSTFGIAKESYEVTEETPKLEDTEEEDKKTDEEIKEEVEKEIEESTKLMEASKTKTISMKEIKDDDEEDEDTFYTDTTSFSKKDFASFEESDKGGSVIVKILVVIIILALVAGAVIFLNEFLHLGWF